MNNQSNSTAAHPPAQAQGGAAGPSLPFEADVDRSPRNRVDDYVFAELKKSHVSPARPCSDAVFVRRVYLDVIGTLPTADEARSYIESKSAAKRSDLIESLFDRPEFADYWAMKWCDVLRVKAEFPTDLWPMAAQGYSRWVRDCIRDNMPYDRFVRCLLTASGSNFCDPPVNFYRSVPGRKPETIARYIALTFMGTRAEKWPAGRLEGMEPFFSQIGFKATGEWKEEIVTWDPAKKAAWQASGEPVAAVFPGGPRVQLKPDRDPRAVFAGWLTDPGNPWLSRCVVNRIWYWLFGRGIIQEPDDIRHDNPPGNAPLLEYLQRALVYSNFDLRSVYRVILNSQTYGFSSLSTPPKPSDEALFASYLVRRLDAEVLIDAIDQVSGGTEQYVSEIPEPFTFLPDTQRAISIPDGSITSAFLDMFGRPGRNTGLAAERDNRFTPGQRLHLLNSSHIRNKIDRIPQQLGLIQAGLPFDQALDTIYLSILSRFPTDAERAVARDYMQHTANSRRDALIDVSWAAINSAEFLYKH